MYDFYGDKPMSFSVTEEQLEMFVKFFMNKMKNLNFDDKVRILGDLILQMERPLFFVGALQGCVTQWYYEENQNED